MKRAHLLFLLLVLTLAVAAPTRNSAPSAEDFQAFWQKFKTAVIKGDKETIAALSRFPIGMSYGKRSIKTKPELILLGRVSRCGR